MEIPKGKDETKEISGLFVTYSKCGNVIKVNEEKILYIKEHEGDFENTCYNLNKPKIKELGLEIVEKSKFDPSIGQPLGYTKNGHDLCDWRSPKDAKIYVLYIPVAYYKS